MPDSVYLKVRDRVERRLSKSTRLVTIHALLFTAFSVPVGLWSKFTHPSGAIDGVVYWVIFFWSILLFAHAGYVYLHSGAWRRNREQCIQEEVLDAGDTFDLADHEMIDLHLRLSDDIRIRSEAFSRVMLNGLGNLALWPGVLVVMLVVRWSEAWSPEYDFQFSVAFNLVLTLALLGTLLLSFALPIHTLRQKAPRNLDDLRAIYGYKRKRPPMESADLPLPLMEIGDDGEVELKADDGALKRKL